MYLVLLILSIIGVAIAGYILVSCLLDDLSLSSATVVSGLVVILFLAGIGFNAVGLITTEEQPNEHVVIKSTEIVQLRDGTNVSGNFFLGIGAVESGLTYIYYVEEDGGYKIKSVDADETTIYYITDGSKPRIETNEVGRYWKSYWQSEWEWGNDFFSSSDRFTTIYVPEGSIRQYYLDGSGQTQE